MAELILAIGILGAVIVIVSGLFTSLLRSSTKSTNLTAGQLFASQKLEQLIQSGTYDTDTAGAAGTYVTDAVSQVNFYYQVTRANVSAVTHPKKGYQGAIYVSVQVWWNTSSPTVLRVGTGLQTTTASRLVYTRNRIP